MEIMVDQKVIRHSVYLTDSVWSDFRKRAIDEKTNANAIIENLLREFLQRQLPLPPGHYRSHVQSKDEASTVRVRSVRIPVDLSKAIMDRLDGQASFSNLVDYLVRLFLSGDIKITARVQEQKAEQNAPAKTDDQQPPENTVNSAGMKFLLGKDSFTIDLNNPSDQPRPSKQ